MIYTCFKPLTNLYMDYTANPEPYDRKIEIDENSLPHFNEIRKWTMFISVTGFIILGLIILIIIFSIPFSPGNSVFLRLLPLLLICIIYIIPVYYLFKFSRLSREALTLSDSMLFSRAMKNLKRHYRFMGVLLICGLCLYFLGFLISLAKGNLPHFYETIRNAGTH